MKDVDFKPKFVDFLRGTTSLLVPLKFFTLLPTTNNLVRLQPNGEENGLSIFKRKGPYTVYALEKSMNHLFWWFVH